MSETMTSLRRQLDVTRDLQSVVTTMRALAAVNIRQYQEAVAALEEYRRTIALGLRIVLFNNPQAALEEVRPPHRQIAVVIGSDQGLVGQFNRHVVDHAHQTMQQWAGDQEMLLVCAVGQRVVPQLADHGYAVDAVLRVPNTKAAITPIVRRILFQVAAWRDAHQINQLVLFHNRPTSQASYTPERIQLLPLDAEWLATLREAGWDSRTLPTSRIDELTLFRQLIQQHLFASLYYALASSLASENASRLASMENAKQNIEERLSDLEHRFNQQRQSAITEELFDVMAGFELLRDE